MCSKGWIDFDLSCALVLGSNIGTTITPILASLSGNIAAKRTAMGHLLFNLLGTIWALILFFPFVQFTAWLTELIGQGDPFQLSQYVNHLEATAPDIYNHLFDNSLPVDNPHVAKIAAMQVSVSFGLSIFHTVFNIINVAIMIWFCNLFVKIVKRLVPQKQKSDDEEFQLRFISRGILSASELNISQAEKEVDVYAQRVARMITMSEKLVHTKPEGSEFTELQSRLEKYEDISDRMEIEIASYLNRVSEGRLSNESKLRIASLMRIVSEIESIADACSGTGKILIRKQQSHAHFNDEIYANIDQMFKYVHQAMDQMLTLVGNLEHATEAEIVRSYNLEREINNYRNQLRSANIENISNHHYDYQEGIYYMDIIGNLEKTGDYIINVVDAVRDLYRLTTAKK